MPDDSKEDDVRVPDALRRILEAGLDRLGDRPDQLRQKLGEMRLPREAWSAILGQLDDRKSGLSRLVAREVRDLLRETNFAEELVKAMTTLSFEIKTEVRFVPNDAGRAKPKVRSRVRVKADGEGKGDAESAEERDNAGDVDIAKNSATTTGPTERADRKSAAPPSPSRSSNPKMSDD